MTRFGRGISVLAILIVATSANAADVSAYVVATSDFVYRGASQSDGDPAIQAGVDVAFESGWYTGVWASTVDLQSPVSSRDTEVRGYLGYGLTFYDRYRLYVSAVGYRYPGSSGNINYDNEEFGISLGIDDALWIEYAYSSDLYESGWETHNIELVAERPIFSHWTLSAGLGMYRVNNQTRSDTAYWNVGLSRSFGRFDLDLRQHAANEPVPRISTSESTGSRFALSVRYNF